jgi:hypothetical protein
MPYGQDQINLYQQGDPDALLLVNKDEAHWNNDIAYEFYTKVRIMVLIHFV